MPDRTISDDSSYKALSRIALYVLLLALTVLGIDIFSLYDGFNAGLSRRAAVGFVPLVLRSGATVRGTGSAPHSPERSEGEQRLNRVFPVAGSLWRQIPRLDTARPFYFDCSRLSHQ